MKSIYMYYLSNLYFLLVVSGGRGTDETNKLEYLTMRPLFVSERCLQ